MDKRKSSIGIFTAIIIIVSFLAYTSLYGLSIFGYDIHPFGDLIKRGLDLQGGVSVVMEIQADKIDEEELEAMKSLLDLRVNKIGVSETVTTTEGEKRVRIDIPGVFNSSEIVQSLQTTGELTFRDPEGEIILEGSDVKSAAAMLDQNGMPTVSLKLNDSGSEKFKEATGNLIGKSISINMDDEQLSNPRVNDQIDGGEAIITGMASNDEAQFLAGIINSGALPYPVKAIETKTVGASLGAGVMSQVKLASMVGVGIIFLLLIAVYKKPGIFADVALAIYIWLLLFVFYSIGATLSLAGIAGFLLTVGMAVDANILVFERIKEELRHNENVIMATKEGFKNAQSSIIDANITTIIAGLVLYFVGSGSVKGFALTLMIGIVLSMFTSLFVTKYLISLGIHMRVLKTPKDFGVKAISHEAEEKRNTRFDFIKYSKIWQSVAALVIIAGIGFGIFRGLNLGIDFKGGTTLVVEMGQDFDKEELDVMLETYDKDIVSQKVDGTQIEIRSQGLGVEKMDGIAEDIKEKYALEGDPVLSLTEIGAVIGKELTTGGIKAVLLASVLMLIYITIRFKGNFGFAAILSLIHDIIFTLAIYAIFAITINTPFIAAMLTILGYSINDSIVIFDRIRENKNAKPSADEKVLANLSLNQSIRRSIYTMLTTLIPILSVYIFVPQIRDFALPISVGIVAGGMSSIFIASPIWIFLENKLGKNRKKLKA